MKWAHYLLDAEKGNDPKALYMPAGFIFHFHESEIVDAAGLQKLKNAGAGQAEVSHDVGFFTHRIKGENKEVVPYNDYERNKYFPVLKQWAQYLPKHPSGGPDGFIEALVSRPLVRPFDLAVHESKGAYQIEVPMHVDHYTHRIDHEKGTHVPYTEEEKKKHFPPAHLTVSDHVFLALVKKGDIDLSTVHDEELNRLNKSLEHYHGAGAKLIKG